MSQPVHRDELEYVKMRIKESSSPSSFSSPPTSSSSTLPAIGSRAAWRQMTSSSSASYMPRARPLSERVVSRNYERPIDRIDLRRFYDDLELEEEELPAAAAIGMGGVKLRLSNNDARPKSELFLR